MLAEEPGGMGWHAAPSVSLFPAVLLQMVLPGGAGAERTQVLRAPGEEPASEEAVGFGQGSTPCPSIRLCSVSPFLHRLDPF